MSTSGPAAPEGAEALAWRIAHCPYFSEFDAGGAGSCQDIIASQGLAEADRYPPESWTGRLATAPVLFIAANPNTKAGRRAPQAPDQPAELLRFNEEYFDGHDADGVPTWRRLRQWTSQLLGVDAVAGRDFAITDAVRCASSDQIGVQSALTQCVETWLADVLTLSGAHVIGWCGSVALTALAHLQRDPVALAVGDISGQLAFYGRERRLIGLPHPADRFRGDDQLLETDFIPQALADLTAWVQSTTSRSRPE